MHIKKKLLIIPIVAGIVFLSGCKEKLKEGEIYNKEFIPAHTETVLISTVHTDGKMSYTTVMPYVYYYSDSYEIDIRDYNEEEKEYDTATYYVTEEVYNQCEIGSIFKYEKGRDFTEIPHTRKEANSDQKESKKGDL